MAGQILEVQVDCYAGYRGEQEPRRFHMGKRAVGVTAIVDRWLAPDHRYFKIRGDDDDLYILRHDPQQELWEVVFYRHQFSPDPPEV